METMLILYALLGLGAVWTLIWFMVVTRVSQAASASEISARAARLRGRLIYPVLGVLAIGLMALLTRLARSTMLDVLSEDYIRTARAKGLPYWTVVAHHALRNALIPLVTVVGLQFGYILGGAVVIETVFTWPGVGLFTIQAISNRDYPVVQASVLILSTAVVLINLAVDLVYGVLDPRIRVRA